MRIDNILGFGKYKGLTFRQVYQGTDKLDSGLIQSFLKYKLEKDAAIIALNEPFLRIDNIQINSPFIKVEPYDDHFQGNWSKNIENMFSEGKGLDNFLRGNTTLDEFYTKYYRLSNKTSLIGGNPEYIDWIIKKLDGFWFDDEFLKELTSLDVYRFAGIKVTYKKDNIYEYVPSVLAKKYSFPKSTLQINNKKSYGTEGDDGTAIEEDERRRAYYRSENARNTFDSMTDGRIGSYDDWLDS